MAEFDHGTKMIAQTTGLPLTRLARVQCQRLEPLESTLQATTELLADRVFLARNRRERFVVYFEFSTVWDPDAPWDLHAKAALLSQRERLATVCIVVILQRRGYRETGEQFRLEAAGGPTQQLWYREVRLWQQRPEPWWEEQPGLMALYPLCQHGRAPREAIQYAAAAIERQVPSPIQRADNLFLLSIYGGLAYPQLNAEAIIGSEKMKESPVLRRHRLEERTLTLREAIVKVLKARRFEVPSQTDLDAALAAIDNLTELDRLLSLAVSCGSVDDFLAGLPTTTTTSRRRRR
jgi:hypothetical protein